MNKIIGPGIGVLLADCEKVINIEFGDIPKEVQEEILSVAKRAAALLRQLINAEKSSQKEIWIVYRRRKIENAQSITEIADQINFAARAGQLVFLTDKQVKEWKGDADKSKLLAFFQGQTWAPADPQDEELRKLVKTLKWKLTLFTRENKKAPAGRKKAQED